MLDVRAYAHGPAVTFDVFELNSNLPPGDGRLVALGCRRAETCTLQPIRLYQSCLNYLTVMVAVKISSARDATAARRSVQMGWIEPSMAAMPS